MHVSQLRQKVFISQNIRIMLLAFAKLQTVPIQIRMLSAFQEEAGPISIFKKNLTQKNEIEQPQIGVLCYA